MEYIRDSSIGSFLRSLGGNSPDSDSSGSTQGPVGDNGGVTVGYELEVLVGCLDHPQDPDPDDERWYVTFTNYHGRTLLPETMMTKCKIIEVIREAGLPAIANSSEAANPDRLPPGLSVSRYYQVVQDASLHGDQWDCEQNTMGYEWVGAEVISRVLRYPDESTREIDTLCRSLREKLRLHLNSTTGFHVHISVSHLSLTQLKKFLSLYWVVEDVLFWLCAPHRLESVYCEPVRVASEAVHQASFQAMVGEPSRMRLSFPDFVPDDIRRELLPIWMAEDRYDLMHLLLKPVGSEFAVDRNALALRPHGPIHATTNDHDVYTVEFRHLQGTVDPTLIKNWTDVLVALLHGATKERSDFKMLFQDLLHSASLPPTQACHALLADLGLESSIPFWAQQRDAYQLEASQRVAGLEPRNPFLSPITSVDAGDHDRAG